MPWYFFVVGYCLITGLCMGIYIGIDDGEGAHFLAWMF
jgi:hypothetical protein